MADLAHFNLRYDGREARHHRLDMRTLGASLQGVDRILNSTIIVAFEGRLPKPRERAEVAIVVEAPRAHCLDIPAALAAAPGVLPFVHSVLVEYGTEFVTTALSYVLSKLGGRAAEADVHFTALMELTREMQAVDAAKSDRLVDRLVDLNLQTQANMLALAETLKPAARDAVAPVGRSCDRLVLPATRRGPATEIDVAMADAIRAKEPLEVGNMEKMKVFVDTVSISRRAMKVRLGEDETLVDAAIRDPAFDESPEENVYTRGLGGHLIVDAKASRRAETGDLVRLHVMNAEAA